MRIATNILPLFFALALVGAGCNQPNTTSSLPSIDVSADVTNNTPITEDDRIRPTNLTKDQIITSPFILTGEARGNWYFEASFPVKLLDGNGNVLATTYAQAQGEWMTSEFVPFVSTITFSKPTTSTGTLVLEKDNPSGLPEHDDARVIPVRF